MAVEIASLLSDIVPRGVAVAEFQDTGQALPLHPDEAVHVANAVDRRRRDFAAGRFCARAALLQLGLADVVIPRAADGRPVWPDGLVGSITHTTGYAAALAARERDFLGVGVDAERAGKLTDDMLPLLFGPQERVRLEALSPAKRSFAATILFSAKEAYFKAWYPLTERKLSFQALHVELEGDAFTVGQPDTDGWNVPVAGRLAIEGDLVVTVLCLPGRPN